MSLGSDQILMLPLSFFVAITAISAFILTNRFGSRRVTRSRTHRHLTKSALNHSIIHLKTRVKTRSIFGEFPELGKDNRIAELIVLSERYLAEEMLIQDALYRFEMTKLYPVLYSKNAWDTQTHNFIHDSILNKQERIQVKAKINALIMETGYDAIKAEDKLIVQLKAIFALDKLLIPDSYLAQIDPDFANYVINIANRQLIDKMLTLPIGEEGAMKVITIWNETYCPFSTGYTNNREYRYFLVDSILETFPHFFNGSTKALGALLCEYIELTAPFAHALEIQGNAPGATCILNWIRGPQIDVLVGLKGHTVNPSSQTIKE